MSGVPDDMGKNADYVLRAEDAAALPCRQVEWPADTAAPSYACGVCGEVMLTGVPLEEVNAIRAAPVGSACPHCSMVNVLDARPVAAGGWWRRRRAR